MSRHDLSSAPGLLPMYAKAAATAVLPGFVPGAGGGDTLPDSTYTLADQHIDRAHLEQFEQVCGYPTSDVLPPTYLHVLAFPLSVALMTEGAFPFPLIGLVHVNNTITVARPVHADESVSFSVRAADLREHPAGRQFDLLAEATVDGETVWTGRSTYLRRGGGSRSGDKRRSEQAPQPGLPARVRVPGDIGRRYAAVSGDRNPIHLHPLTARAFGFPSAIAHGMWLKARTLASLQGLLPDAYTVDVAFKLPVLLPSTVLIAAASKSSRWDLDVRDGKSGKPHLSGAVTTA